MHKYINIYAQLANIMTSNLLTRFISILRKLLNPVFVVSLILAHQFNLHYLLHLMIESGLD